jgi:periplasmic protein CpxP/Spy
MKNKTLMFGIAILTFAVNLSFAQVPVQTTPTPTDPNSTEKQEENGKRKGEGKRKNGGKKNKEGKQNEKDDNDDNDDDKKGNYDRRDSKDENDNDEAEKNDKDGQKRENKVNTPEVRATKMTERMTRQLGLDEATAKNVNAIALERANKVDVINNSTDDKQTKQAAFVANKQDFEAKLKGVLSADQFAKYQSMENGGGNKGNKGNNENRGNRGNSKGKKSNRGGKDKGDN